MIVNQHIYTTIFATLILIATVLTSCNNNRQKTTPVIQDITESVYASGTIKAVGQYDVFSPANGILKETLVKAGDTIEPGSPMFVIDNTVSSLSSENARIAMELLKDKTGAHSNTLLDLEGRLKMAHEKMENDSVLLNRQRNLWGQQAGSKLELEKRELAYKASKTEYESINLQYNQTKLELEKAYQQSLNSYKISQKQTDDFVVKSNIRGTVYSILREPGEWVGVQTPVAVIGESNRFEIELQVDEFDIVKVKAGQKIYVTMDSYRGQVFDALIMKVEPFMNPRTRTFTVFAEFVTLPEVIYPNFSVEANILIAQRTNALTIPSSYLLDSNMVLTSANETTLVTVGIRNMQWTEIVDGLNKDGAVYMPEQ